MIPKLFRQEASLSNNYEYGEVFFDYIERGARRSATEIVPVIAKNLKPSSVLDVGCGRGIWIDEWTKAGVADCIGLDGAYVNQRTLAFSRDHFIAHDLSKPIDLGRKFDIVQSLEVAEHIDAAYSDVFIDNICCHADLIIFSAAVPGQGGETHINEQPLEFWRRKFEARGYYPHDWIRPSIATFRKVEPWYRYNSLLYATDRASRMLPSEVRRTRIPTGMRVPNVAPLNWRARNTLLRCLPNSMVHQLAVVKHRLLNLLTR